MGWIAYRYERFRQKRAIRLRRKRALSAAPYLELKRLGIVDYFKNYPKRAIKPQWDDLHGIYLLITERKPKVILELGGGYSTFVIAHATRELRLGGHDVSFWSVDESQFWQDVVKTRLPPSLVHYVQFWHSEPGMITVNGEPAARFAKLPVETANLVYVDGGLPPGHTRDAGSDAYFLESDAPPDYAILVDGRKATCAFLRRNLRHRYETGTNAHGTQTLFTRSASPDL